MTGEIAVDIGTEASRNPEAITADLDGELVTLCVERGLYLGLADSARAIWEYLDRPRKIGELICWLLERYDIDRPTCERDVQTFLAELESAGLIRIAVPAAT